MDRLYAVIGDPIEHSLSPVMHHYWYKENRLPHHYHALHVLPRELANAVKGLKAIGIGGFNVTIPHKVAILPLLDAIDEEAKLLGAVNTVVNQDGRLVGYNTDGLGFLESLKASVPGFLAKKNPSVLIIGAGGAARAVSLTLAKYAAERVDIINRTMAKAESLSLLCESYCKSHAKTLEQAVAGLSEYDLIINTTSVGLFPNSDDRPIPLSNSNNRAVIVDLIYRPLVTKWLKEANNMGRTTLNGLPMLIYQGALAYKHWFGHMPELAGIQAYLERKLEDSHVNK